MTMAWWCDEQESGSPTEADELWYWQHVALAHDRPPAVNRQPEPMDGQLDLLVIDDPEPIPSRETTPEMRGNLLTWYREERGRE